MKYTIGIIGTGAIGSALAKHLAKTDYNVLIANRRGPDSLSDLVSSLGESVKAMEIKETIEQSDVLFIAVPWKNLDDIATEIQPHKGKLIIDATNNIVSLNPFQLADLAGKPTGSYVSDLFPTHLVVKAFNTLPAATLATPTLNSVGKTTIFISGDNIDAKKDASLIIAEMGFVAIDIGTFHEAARLQDIGGALSGVELVRVGGSSH